VVGFSVDFPLLWCSPPLEGLGEVGEVFSVGNKKNGLNKSVLEVFDDP
jgi:hypothetical protein